MGIATKTTTSYLNSFVLIALPLYFFAFSVSAAPCSSIDDMLLRYEMGEASGDLIDSVGSIDAAPHGSPDYQQNGAIGYGVEFFDESLDAFEMGDDLFNSNNTGTIAIWFNTSNNDLQTLLRASDPTLANSIWGFYLYDGYPNYQIRKDDATLRNVIREDSDTWNDGQWHNFIVSSNGTQYFIWLDGDPKTVTIGQGANDGKWLDEMSAESLTWWIGLSNTSGLDKYFEGVLDDFRYYDCSFTDSLAEDLNDTFAPPTTTTTTTTTTSTTTTTLTAVNSLYCGMDPNPATIGGDVQFYNQFDNDTELSDAWFNIDGANYSYDWTLDLFYNYTFTTDSLGSFDMYCFWNLSNGTELSVLSDDNPLIVNLTTTTSTTLPAGSSSMRVHSGGDGLYSVEYCLTGYDYTFICEKLGPNETYTFPNNKDVFVKLGPPDYKLTDFGDSYLVTVFTSGGVWLIAITLMVSILLIGGAAWTIKETLL